MASKYYDERDERSAPGDDQAETQADGWESEQPLGTPSSETESERNTPESRHGSVRQRAGRKSPSRPPTDGDGAAYVDEGDDETESGSELVELAEKGFTADEAIRLIHVSQRAAMSREAREAEETLRRLRFTRWLIEHGMLDEFSA